MHNNDIKSDAFDVLFDYFKVKFSSNLTSTLTWFCGKLRCIAMRLFTLWPSALGVERLWYGARRALTDTRESMSLSRLVEPLLVKMDAALLNDNAFTERLGLHGSAGL
jgi:hypothetical protein